jgi:hypothetical protein
MVRPRATEHHKAQRPGEAIFHSGFPHVSF